MLQLHLLKIAPKTEPRMCGYNNFVSVLTAAKQNKHDMKGRILLLLVFWVFCLFPGCGKDEPGKVSKPVLKINVLEKLVANGQGFF